MISRIRFIVNELALLNSTHGMAPAFIETFSRILAYSETESLGFKVFFGKLCKTVWFNNSVLPNKNADFLLIRIELLIYFLHKQMN